MASEFERVIIENSKVTAQSAKWTVVICILRFFIPSPAYFYVRYVTLYSSNHSPIAPSQFYLLTVGSIVLATIGYFLIFFILKRKGSEASSAFFLHGSITPLGLIAGVVTFLANIVLLGYALSATGSSKSAEIDSPQNDSATPIDSLPNSKVRSSHAGWSWTDFWRVPTSTLIAIAILTIIVAAFFMNQPGTKASKVTGASAFISSFVVLVGLSVSAIVQLFRRKFSKLTGTLLAIFLSLLIGFFGCVFAISDFH